LNGRAALDLEDFTAETTRSFQKGAKPMAINAGIWIDHHKAVVVLLADKGEEILQILSGHDAPGSHSPSDFVAEDKRERKEMIHLNKFYDEVIDRLREANAIVVLGPGEAKGEFTKRIEEKKLKARIAHVETADKMTDREIAAHVRQLLGSTDHKTSSSSTDISRKS
jgi:stalled ribosome rescue protein Dom34